MHPPVASTISFSTACSNRRSTGSPRRDRQEFFLTGSFLAAATVRVMRFEFFQLALLGTVSWFLYLPCRLAAQPPGDAKPQADHRQRLSASLAITDGLRFRVDGRQRLGCSAARLGERLSLPGIPLRLRLRPTATKSKGQFVWGGEKATV
jgi:hypothetical protein